MRHSVLATLILQVATLYIFTIQSKLPVVVMVVSFPDDETLGKYI